MTYFDQIYAINDIFTDFMSIHLTDIILETFREKLFDQFPQILPLGRYFGPQK